MSEQKSLFSLDEYTEPERITAQRAKSAARFWIRIEADSTTVTEDSPYGVYGYQSTVGSGALTGRISAVRFPAKPKLYRTVKGAEETAKRLRGEGRTVTVAVWKGVIE